MLGPMDNSREAEAKVKGEQFQSAFKQFKHSNCTEKGDQPSNLTICQQQGLKKISKRIKDRELVELQTDKTDKLVAVSLEKYLEMGKVHTAGDEIVTWDDCVATQRLIAGHTSSWIKMLGVGKMWDHAGRIRESCVNKSVSINPMYCLIKDHKHINPGDIFKTRPVVSSHLGMAYSWNNLLSEVIESISKNMQERSESISTESFLARVERVN